MGGGSASHGFSRRNDARADSSQAGIGVKWADPTPVPGASGPTGTAAHRQSGQVQDVLPGAHSADARAGATLASMLRLLETFFRHRLLLLGPVALVIAGSIGWVVIQPPAYDSSVRMWVERQTLVPDPNSNPYLSPAQEQAAVLTELLSTKYFDSKVGKRSRLADSIRTGAAGSQDGMMTRVTQALARALGRAGSPAELSSSQVDDQVAAIISSRTIVIPTGPEVITLTFRAGSSDLAARVAQAIADQYLEETLANQRVQADAAVAFYTSQMKQSQADLSVADKAVDDYLLTNPGQRGANAIPDARLVQLRRDDDAAHQRLQTVQDKLDQARLNRVALDQVGVNGLRVLDRAEAPTSPSSIRKVALEATGVGLVLATLIVVVGVLVLTWMDSTIRRPQEVEDILDLRPVGSVPRVG